MEPSSTRIPTNQAPAADGIPPEIDRALDASQAQWKQTFIEGPQTSFGMVRALMEYLEVNYETLLTNPEVLLGAFKTKRPLIDNIEDERWAKTWRNPGRCTSFAVKIARALEEKDPNTFKFRYFDLGRHRVARCERTEILIDSTSNKGARRMSSTAGTGDADWADEYRRGRYKYHSDGFSIFEGNESDGTGPEVRKEVYPICPAEAMSTCLEEIAQNAVLICVFRCFTNNEPNYLSLVRWNICKRRMELTPNMTNKEYFYCITFDRTRGNKTSHDECVDFLKYFIEDMGNMEQWKVEDVISFNRKLWNAAVKLWGDPYFSHPPAPALNLEAPDPSIPEGLLQ